MGFAVADLMRGRGTDEVRAAVGRRLAGVDRSPHNTLGDNEDSPLQQSKRSSTCNFQTNEVFVFRFPLDVIYVFQNIAFCFI